MAEDRSFTLSDVARRLDVPQHRLIHLCEKGVVVPDVHGAAGRGSSRVFSERNFLEFAVALRLRDMMLPVGAVGAIIHVLSGLEERLRDDLSDFALARSLRDPQSPELRIIVSDGQTIYFSLGAAGQQPKLFGGIPLDQLAGYAPGRPTRVEPVRLSDNGRKVSVGLGPESSHFARLEVSVTAIAREVPIE